MSIPISAKDVEEIQEIANVRGIPYETLISGIISRYLTTRHERNDKPADELDQT